MPARPPACRVPRAGAAFLVTIAAVVATATAAQVPSQASLTFEEASLRLGRVSDALAAAEANVRGKQELAAASRRLRLPEISLDAREIKFQKTLEVSLGAFASDLAQFGVPDPLILQQGGWRFRPTVQASVPLYTGGQIPAAQAAADAAVRQADAEWSGESDEQIAQLVQVYFGQQLASQALRVRQDVREGLQRHLDDAEKLAREGLATTAERLQANVERDQAERDLQKAVNDLDSVSDTLMRLLRHDSRIDASSPLFVVTRPIGQLEEFQQSAREHHPAISRLHAITDQAGQGVRFQQSKLKPQVFLFGQRDLNRADALLTDPDWVFGAGIKYTLFSSSDRPRQISAARSQLRQAEAAVREAENQVAIGVDRAWTQLGTARQQFMLLDSSIARAEENLRLQEISFREGQARSLDVIDARLQLARASIERAQAAYQYDVALADLLRVSARMSRFVDYLKQADEVISP